MRLVSGKHKKDHRRVVNKIKGNGFKIRKNKHAVKEEVVNTIINKLHITEDIWGGAEIISLVGKRHLVIENYVKVIEYEPEKIIIKTKKNYVVIEGDLLKIEYLLDIELRISGKIKNISFMCN